jgi:hypothetical protein
MPHDRDVEPPGSAATANPSHFRRTIGADLSMISQEGLV